MTKDRIRGFFKSIFSGLEESSTSIIEKDLQETENVFAIITTGAFIGIPLPSTGILLRILPYMQREIFVMTKRSREMDDVFGEIAGMFDID